jgi:hypothetical protein
LQLSTGRDSLSGLYNLARDEAIYNTAAQTTQTGGQVNEIRRDIQAPPQQPIELRQPTRTEETPLKKKVEEQKAAADKPTTTVESAVLQEILQELRAIRENLSKTPRTDEMKLEEPLPTTENVPPSPKADEAKPQE